MYELGSILQIYYHLQELSEIVFHILEQMYVTAMDVTRQCFVSLLVVVSHAKPSSSSSSSSSSSTVIDTWSWQIRTCMVQIQTIMEVLQTKQDPVTRTKLYTTLFTTFSGLDSIPKVYHEYIHRYNIPSSSSTFFVSLFWYRYCAFLSQMVSDAMNGQISSKKNDITSSSSSSSTMMIVSSYPALHVAAATILQPLLQQQQQQSHTPTTSSTTPRAMHGTIATTTTTNNNDMMYQDFTSGITDGILGGTSLAIIPLSDFYSLAMTQTNVLDNPQSGFSPYSNIGSSGGGTGSWTIPQHEQHHGNETLSSYTNSVTLTSAMKQTTEWKVYQGQFVDDNHNTKMGLYPLQQAFIKACTDRLMVPLQYMFHENVAISDDGVSMSTGILILPSKYDLQRFDENIRDEFALALPPSGSPNGSIGSSVSPVTGGDMTLMVQLIAQCVNSIISEFCIRAKSAMSQASYQQHHHHQQQHGESYMNEKDWSMTESMKHDCKIVAILYTMKQYLQSAPDKVFVAPYRVAGSGSSNNVSLQQHTKTAAICTETLIPACVTIDATIQKTILIPFCRTLNHLIATNVLSKIQLGIYLDNTSSSGRNNYEDMNEDDDIPLSFIQKDVVPILDKIVQIYLVKFPPTYSNVIVCNVVSFIVYSYLSNVTLLRPLSESIRLHITQDLTDLEMALEQFLSKAATSSSNSKLNFTSTSTRNVTTSLQEVDNGRPYAELRAVRQMLFWTGLDTKSKPADDIAKSLLNEMWVKDIRASTIFHYLFSYGPNMLSSPYHVKRISATEYVSLLVPHDMMFGNVSDSNSNMEGGEDVAFMTIMACCDSYTQRASVSTSTINTTTNDPTSGDPRIAQIVITFGQELLRRRGRQ